MAVKRHATVSRWTEGAAEGANRKGDKNGGGIRVTIGMGAFQKKNLAAKKPT